MQIVKKENQSGISHARNVNKRVEYSIDGERTNYMSTSDCRA